MYCGMAWSLLLNLLSVKKNFFYAPNLFPNLNDAPISRCMVSSFPGLFFFFYERDFNYKSRYRTIGVDTETPWVGSEV